MIQFKRVGLLTQAAEELPFTPKRVYWIHTGGQARGGHAHFKTEQVFTCVRGYYTLVVDNGIKIKEHWLSQLNPEGVFISTEWHTMKHCSDDCIILVMASRHCDEKDYIRDYKQWKEWRDGTRSL